MNMKGGVGGRISLCVHVCAWSLIFTLVVFSVMVKFTHISSVWNLLILTIVSPVYSWDSQEETWETDVQPLPYSGIEAATIRVLV